MESSIRVLFALVLFGSVISAVLTGCPTLSVSPCTCTDSPFPVLVCDNVIRMVEINDVIRNSAGANYTVVRITNSLLHYIPAELFERAEVQELQLVESRFIGLFNEPPKNATSLKTLHIENSSIQRGIKWQHFQVLNNLRNLSVVNSRVMRYLGKEFIQYAPKSLQQITLFDTRAKIEQGVFKNLSNLNQLVIENARISKDLQRSLLPVPFNGRVLHLKECNVKSLPGDMFSDMPNLREVSLFGNKLTTVPTSPFDNLQYLNLEGNPLNCDCNLAWITKYESLVVKGKCSTPPTLHGKDMRDAYKTMTC